MAVYCCVWDKVSAERLGLTATWSVPWVTVTVAVLLLVVSATEVAVRVTVAGLGTLAGAL
jgi:hypothetical protein